jgi:hypothetical protein
MLEPTQVEHLKEAPFTAKHLALSTNIRLGMKVSPGTNTSLLISDVKSLITLGSCVNFIQTFFFVVQQIEQAKVFFQRGANPL